MSYQNHSYQNYLLPAIDQILAWDISEESFAGAVKEQACLMAGIDSEEIMWVCWD